MAGEPPPSALGKKWLAVVTLLSTLLITFVLLARLQSGEHDSIFNAGGVGGNVVEDVSPIDDSSIFALHPNLHHSRQPQTFEHHWRITKDVRRPDGVLKDVYLINDAFPGPTLECRPGDRLVITVENALSNDEGVAVHWHGLAMRNANAMDGAAGITQIPTVPGESFTYDFVIDQDQSGTFWYHAHEGVQRADGLYGGLVVHAPKGPEARHNVEGADEPAEHLLLLSDWYHRPAQAALEFYMHPGAFGLETVPDSILVSGLGAYNCSNAVAARPVDCETIERRDLPGLKLNAGKRNILRLVNVGAYAGVQFGIKGATIAPLSLDGDHAVPATPAEKVGFLHPGERMSVLVQSLEPRSDEEDILRMEIDLDTATFKYQNLALTPSQRFPISWFGDSRSQPAMPNPEEVPVILDVQTLTSLHPPTPALPAAADHTILLYAITQKLAHLENEPHGFINRTTWRPQSQSPLLSVSRTDWDKNQFVPRIPYSPSSPAWVDIVLNNLDEEGHPFHLHGYDFWVLSTFSSTHNWGSWNPFTAASSPDMLPPGGNYDLESAVKRDTVYVPRRGYAVLRFQADNPGIWMLHCHVLWHLASGMAMALEVSEGE